MDNSKQYLKIYQELGEESFNKWGYYYPPKNWEDLNSWNYNTYEKFLKEKEDGVNKTEIYIKLLDTINNFGFYLAFQNIDYELLNNAIYQSARQQLLNNALIASVHNHPFVLKEVLNSFACNDFDIVQNFFKTFARNSYIYRICFPNFLGQLNQQLMSGINVCRIP